jgi:hypothetical protein
MTTDAIGTYQHPETAQRMGTAAQAFLGSLDATRRAKASLDFADEKERTDWHYIPRDRPGLPIKEMDATQRQLAHALVETGLGPLGRQKVKTIMGLESVLADLEGPDGRFLRDPELYYLSIFGQPGDEGPWGWRFEGHHISLNNTVAGGRLVGGMPVFLGSNPAQVRHGDLNGLRALREEEDLGRQLLFELDGEQQRLAIVNPEAPPDIITQNAPFVTDQVKAEGLRARDMNYGQRQLLRAIVETYLRRLPEEISESELARLDAGDWQDTAFAWAGQPERGGPHYYRVQGADFVAEYDNTQNDANHIHAVWRDLRNDFGADMLRRHYSQDH